MHLDLVHAKMRVGIGGDLRQVRDAQDLMPPSQPPQLLADDVAEAATDALVQLVENEHRRFIHGGQRGLERQHKSSQLTAAGYLRERSWRLPTIRRHQELHAIDSRLVACHWRIVSWRRHTAIVVLKRNLHYEERTWHAQGFSLRLNGEFQIAGDTLPFFRKP